MLTIFMVLAGVTIFAYVASMIVEAIARGEFTGARAERRRRRAIEELRDHYIICGFGRVGRRIAAELRGIVAVGAPEELRALEELFAPREAVAR